jgi:hypothetical protein
MACIVCNSAKAGRQQGTGDFARFHCERCGAFVLSGTAEAVLPRKLDEAPLRRALMSHTLRRMQRRVVAECFRPAAVRTGFELRLLTDEQPAGLIDNQLRAAILAAEGATPLGPPPLGSQRCTRRAPAQANPRARR